MITLQKNINLLVNLIFYVHFHLNMVLMVKMVDHVSYTNGRLVKCYRQTR